MPDPEQNRGRILGRGVLEKSDKVLETSAKAVKSAVDKLAVQPQLLFSGEAAVAVIAKTLPAAITTTVISSLGPVEMRPGTIWQGDRMLVSADTGTTRYVVGDRLYEYSTSAFLRAEWFQVAGKAAAGAKGFVYLAKFEIALLSGIFVHWYILLGLSVASLGLSYYNNRAAYNAALSQAPAVIRNLNELREANPLLFDKLVATAGRDVLTNLPKGISGEDIAFFIGRVIKGIGGAPEITLGAILSTTLWVASVVFATHLPHITAEAVALAAEEHAEQLQQQLAQNGINITKEEAEQIIRDALANPGNIKKLEELNQNLKGLIPVLERLSEVLHR